MVAGAGFVSNLVLWKESGYFDNVAETKPLLHLWSLGVEEQFYIVWPLLLWWAWRRKFNLLTMVILLVTASFFLGWSGVKRDAVAAFYSPLTRFWELLCGAFLAWMAVFKPDAHRGLQLKLDRLLAAVVYREKNARDGETLSNVLAFAGAALLAYGFWRIDKGLGFPGGWALFPVVGAGLVIAAGPQAWVNRTLLSLRPMVWVGLISFPLYLWHWPLLTFARIVNGQLPEPGVRWAAVVLSFVLAWLTYRLIERPIRTGSESKVRVAVLVLLMIAVAGVGYNTYRRDGLGFRMKDRQAFLDHFDNSKPAWKYTNRQGIHAAYRDDCNFYDLEAARNDRYTVTPLPRINQTCHVRDPRLPHAVFIWGDSHSQHLRYGLDQHMPKDWQILQVASSGCAAAIRTEDSDTNYCDKSNYVALEAIKAAKPDVVVIAQNERHDVAVFLDIRNRLTALGVSKVVFVGPVPHWTTDLPKLIARRFWFVTPERTLVGVNRPLFGQNQRLKKQYLANGLVYADVIAELCDRRGCLTRIGDDRLTGMSTYDYGHFPQVTSDYVARQLLVKTIVGP